MSWFGKPRCPVCKRETPLRPLADIDICADCNFFARRHYNDIDFDHLHASSRGLTPVWAIQNMIELAGHGRRSRVSHKGDTYDYQLARAMQIFAVPRARQMPQSVNHKIVLPPILYYALRLGLIAPNEANELRRTYVRPGRNGTKDGPTITLANAAYDAITIPEFSAGVHDFRDQPEYIQQLALDSMLIVASPPIDPAHEALIMLNMIDLTLIFGLMTAERNPSLAAVIAGPVESESDLS